ncbi:shikimate dehydrogenase [Labedaea rhizosphaerae]|uniref:Shikimate dehydrogenase n=1 Tax=Labedaea rhizosphaerae TaxID=598644 RepID=A0A4R6SHC7_LABRH|nr:shikimate dehydrogenase [Labedaea rhizosphaerae]TDQ01205.1 shikimate dehydrogenase [Labedaea rhizosphaerae]
MSTERHAAVLGSPVAHSLSPVLHGAAYEALGLSWTYSRIECDEAGLAPLVGGLDASWIGLSVTMPGKVAALRFADAVSDRASLVGAANTLVRKDSGWFADCTDVDGVTGALGGAPAASAVVLGAGGTARAAIAGLVSLGVKDLALVVRDPARAADALSTASGAGVAEVAVHAWAETDFAAVCARADVVVSTVPPSATEAVADQVAAAGRVLDVIYHPWPTPLAAAVHRRGGRLSTGLDMLLHQAFGQVELFTGRAAPRAAMRDALLAATGNAVPLPL